MKFVIDMNLSPNWTAALRSAGFEAIHWSSIGPVDASDVVIAEFARSNGMAVITNDLDFGKLLSTDRAQLPSVIQIRLGDLRPATLLSTVCQTIEATRADLEKGALVTIGGSKVRISTLPLVDGAP